MISWVSTLNWRLNFESTCNLWKLVFWERIIQRQKYTCLHQCLSLSFPLSFLFDSPPPFFFLLLISVVLHRTQICHRLAWGHIAIQEYIGFRSLLLIMWECTWQYVSSPQRKRIIRQAHLLGLIPPEKCWDNLSTPPLSSWLVSNIFQDMAKDYTSFVHLSLLYSQVALS